MQAASCGEAQGNRTIVLVCVDTSFLPPASPTLLLERTHNNRKWLFLWRSVLCNNCCLCITVSPKTKANAIHIEATKTTWLIDPFLPSVSVLQANIQQNPLKFMKNESRIKFRWFKQLKIMSYRQKMLRTTDLDHINDTCDYLCEHFCLVKSRFYTMWSHKTLRLQQFHNSSGSNTRCF